MNALATHSADVLLQYEAMLHQLQQMLEIARQGDWDRLGECEQVHGALRSTLEAQEYNCQWSEEAQVKKGELIRSILAINQDIRQLLEPRRHELSQIIGSLGTEMKLQKAYLDI